jgi:hypothetical protein
MKFFDELSGIPVAETTSPKTPHKLQVIRKATIVKGKPAKIPCLEIGRQTYAITRGPVTVVGLEDEWYEDVRDPDSVINILANNPGFKPDIFTFWQRLPEIEPRYSFHTEWEEIAVLPIQSYEHWWKHQIKSRVRNLIRKAEKEGVEVRETAYDDEFVRGMTAIFNESPVRQGRRFWHFGKDFETVKRQFSQYVFRERMIGAYYRGELIGFVMLGNAGRFGITGQIISSVKHRDKATTNALVGRSVEICEKQRLPYLVYFFWSHDSLAEFKRRCGFERIRVPRYFVPLTLKGRLALQLGVHRGWKAALPAGLKDRLKKLRRFWNESPSDKQHAAHVAQPPEE